MVSQKPKTPVLHTALPGFFTIRIADYRRSLNRYDIRSGIRRLTPYLKSAVIAVVTNLVVLVGLSSLQRTYADDSPLSSSTVMNLPDSTILLATSSSQSVVREVWGEGANAISYLPYGALLLPSRICSAPGFNGQCREQSTGHYLLGNGYRAFNPQLMSFNSPDSFSPFGEGGLNAYCYVGNDPLNKSDPSGHAPTNIAKAMRRTSVGDMRIKEVFLKDGKRLAPSIFAYKSTYPKKRPALVVIGHGTPEVINSIENGVRSSLNGRELVGKIKSANIDLTQFDSIRLLVCNSAVGDANSLGAQVFAETGLTVKSYAHELATTGPGVSILEEGFLRGQLPSEISHVIYKADFKNYLLSRLRQGGGGTYEVYQKRVFRAK